jgi:alkylation response protein AidB-like acyl-CoA dehydrogenase
VFDNPHSTLVKRRIAASSAKARASQAALYIAGQSVQLHGAIGFTDEYELGIYVNRALTLVPRYGNAAQHRQIYAVTAAE